MDELVSPPPNWPAQFSKTSAICALLAVGFFTLAGPGYRFGFLSVKAALGLTMVAVVTGLLAALVGIVAIFMNSRENVAGGNVMAIIATIVGIAFTVNFVMLFQKASSVPMIHDISTDVYDPPEFVDAIAVREAANADNPAVYDGPAVADAQRAAYPNVRPLETDAGVAAAITAAVAVAEEMDWEIIAQAPEEGRLEATATTGWFGFKDDVVVRARLGDAIIMIDIRSKSRVGESDLGTNAARIMEFRERLAQRLLPR